MNRLTRALRPGFVWPSTAPVGQNGAQADGRVEKHESPSWFTEEDVNYYTQFLSGPEEQHRSFKTLLATVAEVLGETDFQTLLRKLVLHAVRTTRAERGILLLVKDDALHVRVALDKNGDDLGCEPPLARSVAERVFRERRPLIQSVTSDHEVLNLSESAAALRLRQVMCAPLRARGKILGAVYVDSRLRGPPHTDADLKLFHAQAGLMGMAVENHRLFEEAWSARDMQRQLNVARDIQLRLYPSSSINVGGAELGGLNLISAQVGGDYFDYLALDQERVALGIGDVSGHGVAPALIMSDVRARLRSLLRTQGEMEGVFDLINEALCVELADGMYVALFVALYDPAVRALRYHNAGHVPPLLLRADGEIREIEPTAPALGLFDGFPSGPCPIQAVETGDCLLCYTDGVADRPNADGDLYGLDRLKETFREAARSGIPVTEIAAAILADSEEHGQGRSLRDDFTLLVARF